MKYFKKNAIFVFAFFSMMNLVLLVGCGHQAPIKSKTTEPPASKIASDQLDIVFKAMTKLTSGLQRELIAIEVPSARNAISNGVMLLWGMDDTPAAEAIQTQIEKGTAHLAVTGASSRVNLSAVRAALKAASPVVKQPTNIYVFVGDYQPNERPQPSAGIQVHLVRTDGTILP